MKLHLAITSIISPTIRLLPIAQTLQLLQAETLTTAKENVPIHAECVNRLNSKLIDLALFCFILFFSLTIHHGR